MESSPPPLRPLPPMWARLLLAAMAASVVRPASSFVIPRGTASASAAAAATQSGTAFTAQSSDWECQQLALARRPRSAARESARPGVGLRIYPRPTATALSMISNLGGTKKKNDQEPTLPRDVKDAVSKCRAAVQSALEERVSRMDVEMPVGANFGVEKGGGGKRKGKGRMADLSDDEGGGPTKEQLTKSDRELARLFVEMFQPLGGENIAVVFNAEPDAEVARERWKGEVGASCRVLSVDNKKKSKTSKGMKGGSKGGKKGGKRSMGFAAKMAAEINDSDSGGTGGPFAIPPNTEVAVFVAPGPRELIAIERISNEVGMGTLVILLNARLGKVTNYGTDAARDLFTAEFETVFHLAAVTPQECAPNCLLHRSYPDDWILARKPKVGPPKTIAVQADRPTEEECADAYGTIEIGDLEKTTENVLENVAGWFK